MSWAEYTNQLPHVQLCKHTGLRGLIKIGAENDAETHTALRRQLRYVDLNLFCPPTHSHETEYLILIHTKKKLMAESTSKQ